MGNRQRSAGALNNQSAGLQVRIAGLREEREAASKAVDALRDSIVSVRARRATLTQILNDRSYTADAVHKLFAANERGGGDNFRAVGVLADYAEVEEQHETAVEQDRVTNWNTWSSKRSIMLAPVFRCAQKLAGVPPSLSIPSAICACRNTNRSFTSAPKMGLFPAWTNSSNSGIHWAPPPNNFCPGFARLI